MSARKLANPAAIESPIPAAARQARLALSQDAVYIHKSGIEFRSPTAFNSFTEMTVELRTSDNGRVNCTGVVIACTGNKHAGYRVSMVFTELSRVAQTRLHQMSSAGL